MRHTIVVAALVLLVGLGAAVSSADLLQDLGATFERIAQELRSAFPKVDARVVAVDGDTVRIAGAGVEMLRPGLELVAYRKGALFRHPITNQPLAHAEEEVATLVVTGVTAEEATARVAVTEGGRTPVAGDGARLTAGRIPVAVLPPLGVAVPGETTEQTALLLVSRFSALLEKTGRFLAVDAGRVLETAAPAGAEGPPSPLEVARRLKVPAVLTTRVVQDGATRRVETAWISGRTGSTLLTLQTPVVRAVFPPRFAWEQTPELERRYLVEGPIRGLAIADLDGDGRHEVAIADEGTVRIYRWQGAIAGLVPVGGAEFRPGGLILSLDAADVNRTGRAQLVVVDYRGIAELAHSTVLEMRDGELRTIHRAGRRYLRVIQAGSEPWLVAQAVGDADPFASSIRRLVWQDGRYRDGPTLRTPAGVTVYGLTLMRLTGSAEPEVVALTPEDRLAVWTAQGRRLWTSADPYGGPAISFPFDPVNVPKDPDMGVGRILGRVIPLPGGAEGPELLVFENLLPVGAQFRTLLPRLAPLAFSQGRLHRLRWKDNRFVRVWQSRVTEGYIADFAQGDVDGDGLPEMVVAVVPRGLNLATLNPLARPRAHLVFFELP